MFHNNFRVYQVGVEEFNIEIEYWNERIDEVERTNLNVNRNNMEILIGILTNLGFDNRTPEI
jgi:hypothetical protein